MATSPNPSRPEFLALTERLEAIDHKLDTALYETGCIDPANIALDRAARVQQAWRQTAEGKEFEAAVRAMVAEWQAAKRAEANRATYWGRAALVLGIISTFLLLLQQIGDAFMRFIQQGSP